MCSLRGQFYKWKLIETLKKLSWGRRGGEDKILPRPLLSFFKVIFISICKIIHVRNTRCIFIWCTFQFRPYVGPSTFARSVFIVV